MRPFCLSAAEGVPQGTMATDTAPLQTTQDAPASAAPPVVGADPLANASAALSAGLAELANAPADEETETPPAEEAAPDAETPPQEQPAKGPAENNDPQASTEETDTTEPAEPALKAKDEAVLKRLKETDPELHSLFFRRIQGIEQRAATAAFERLRRTQTAAELEGTPMAQDVAALTPEQRTAFLVGLPEYQLEIDRAQGAVATDLAGLLGVDPATLSGEVMADPDKLVGVFLEGRAFKTAIAAARKEAREAGLREGRTLARAGGALPPSGDAARYSIASPKTVEESRDALRSGLAALVGV